MFQTNYIMTQENISYLHNTKEVLVSVAWGEIPSDRVPYTA